MKRTLFLVVVLSVLLRLTSAFYQGNVVDPLPGTHDQISYHELAIRVLEGHGFSFGEDWWPATRADEPTAHWSYLYVLYLSGVYWLFGVNPLVPRLIQALLAGVLQPVLSFRITDRLFGRRVGLVAAIASGFYAYFVYYAGALMTETLYILCILWVLDLATSMAGRLALRLSLWNWVQLGFAAGLAVLFRQVFLFMLPLLLLFLAWRFFRTTEDLVRSAVEIAKGALVIAVLLAMMIAPWTARNYAAFDRIVLLNTNSGFAFFWGNHPIHESYFIPILPAAESDSGTGYGALIPRELRGLNEAELDSALMRRGLGFVLQDPIRYVLLSLSRAAEYFKFWPAAESSLASNVARVLSYGLMLPFLVVGIARVLAFLVSSSGTEEPGFEADARLSGLLLILAAGYTLLHLLSWALIRYRLPVDAMTVPFAALSMVLLWDWFSNRVFASSHPGQVVLANRPGRAERKI